ncbi:hypothetical protein B0H11DRAFT_2258790 [Mycena galericulata]|nr:hypothetical protein B0H11DRAFT_2258790 [Mycena galericulata]
MVNVHPTPILREIDNFCSGLNERMADCTAPRVNFFGGMDSDGLLSAEQHAAGLQVHFFIVHTLTSRSLSPQHPRQPALHPCPRCQRWVNTNVTVDLGFPMHVVPPPVWGTSDTELGKAREAPAPLHIHAASTSIGESDDSTVVSSCQTATQPRQMEF